MFMELVTCICDFSFDLYGHAYACMCMYSWITSTFGINRQETSVKLICRQHQYIKTASILLTFWFFFCKGICCDDKFAVHKHKQQRSVAVWRAYEIRRTPYYSEYLEKGIRKMAQKKTNKFSAIDKKNKLCKATIEIRTVC